MLKYACIDERRKCVKTPQMSEVDVVSNLIQSYLIFNTTFFLSLYLFILASQFTTTHTYTQEVSSSRRNYKYFDGKVVTQHSMK